MKILAGGCLVAIGAWAEAADPDHIDMPVVQVGTTWSIRLSDALTKEVVSQSNVVVQYVNDDEIGIVTPLRRIVGRIDAKTFAVRQSGALQFDPGFQRVRYPLRLDSRWETSYAYVNERCGPSQATQRYRVIGWEDVTVPAGTFRAMRIESVGTWSNSCATSRLTQAHWIADGLAVPVRSEEFLFAPSGIVNSNLRELVSYSKP